MRSVFPEMKGFSPRNPKYMRAFAKAWSDASSVRELADNAGSSEEPKTEEPAQSPEVSMSKSKGVRQIA